MNQADAQFAVAAILATLERDTGQHVVCVEIPSVDVTTHMDSVEQWSRRVSITLRPIPGSQWQLK